MHRSPVFPGFVPGVVLLGGLVGCSEGEAPVASLSRALTAICSVEVIKDGVSLGVKDVEKDYVPNVVICESGDLATEALKAQAVLSRTYVYYKLAGGGTKITSGTSVQVYDCARKIYLAQKHHDAASATAGQILTYQGNPIWPCFNAGASPTAPPCTPKTGVGADNCCTNNVGKSGSGITQSPCGFVDPTNYKNRGCLCQNGADCYAKLGKTYTEILKAYFGDDIGWVTASGSCIKPGEAGVPKLDGVKQDGPAAGRDGLPLSDQLADRRSTQAGDGQVEESADCSCRIGAAPVEQRWLGALLALALVGPLGRRLRSRRPRS